jgi:hypothetical protein
MSKRKFIERDYYEEDEIDYDADKAVRKIKRQNNKNILKKWQNSDDEFDDDFYADRRR